MRIVLLIFGLSLVFSSASAETDKTGTFSFDPPEGWQVIDHQFLPHSLLRYNPGDGYIRNINITDEPDESPLPELQKKYEHSLQTHLRAFKLVSSEIKKLKVAGECILIVHENTSPGIPVRQLNYIITLQDGKRLTVVCTVRKEYTDKYDKLLNEFVNSIKQGPQQSLLGDPQSVADCGSVLATGASIKEEIITRLVDTDKIAEFLGDEWKRDREIVIENEKDVSKLAGFDKHTGQMFVTLLKPHGVIAYGEFSFSRIKPRNKLTIKVHKFSSPSKAVLFRKTHYEHEKAQPLFKKSQTKSATIYDSLDRKKRVVFRDQFWIVCGHIKDDDRHIKILTECLKLEGLPQAPGADPNKPTDDFPSNAQK